MPAKANEGLSDSQRFRHDLVSAVTVICGQTQLLQRQLGRMAGFSDGDRARLAAGLAVILTAARGLDSIIGQLPRIHKDREAS
jgi:uncharacterized Rossmann fold enzyme